jgi:hypothetical protein
MQNIDHKGLCVKCDNVGLLGAIGYIAISIWITLILRCEFYVCLKSYLLVVQLGY